MSDNVSIFSGLAACNPRELVEALHAWREPHGHLAHTYQLAGALMSLALTVEQQAQEIAKTKGSWPKPDASRAKQPDNPADVAAADPDERALMLYAAIHDLRNIASMGIGSKREAAYSRDTAVMALINIETRCRTMLQAAGRLGSDD